MSTFKGIHILSNDAIANLGMHQNGYDKISGASSLGSSTGWKEGDPYWSSIKVVGNNAAVTSGTNSFLRVGQCGYTNSKGISILITVCMFPGDTLFGRFSYILCGPVSTISMPPALALQCGRGGGNHE